MKANTENIRRLVMATIKLVDADQDCPCRHALAEYGGFKL
jgi:5'-methylthioadenosine phosphorylase